MPRPFVCAPCRLKLAASCLRQQRLSNAHWLAQPAHGLHATAAPHDDTTVGIERRSQSAGHDSSHDAPVGRYSRQRLRPQEVLEQLGPAGQETEGKRNNIRRHRYVPSGSPPRRSSATHKPSPPVFSEQFVTSFTALDDALMRRDVEDIYRALQSLDSLQKNGAITNVDRDGIAKSFDIDKKMVAIETAIKSRAAWKATSSLENGPPEVMEMLEILQKLGALDKLTLLRTLRTLAHTIAAGRTRRLHKDASEDAAFYSSVPANFEAELLITLVELWRQFIQARILGRRADDDRTHVDKISDDDDGIASEGWEFLPDIAALKQSSDDEVSLTALRALSLLFGERNVRKTTLRETLLVTYDLLAHHRDELLLQGPTKLYEGVQELERFFASIFTLPGGLGDLNFGRAPRTDRYFEEYLQAMASRLGLTLPEKPDESQVRAERPPKPSKKVLEELQGLGNDQHDELIKRIGRAVERSDNSALERLYRVFKRQQPDVTGEKPSMLRYEGLILAFLTLRHPSRAVDVWNLMLQAGLSPTTRTWTIMLNGCQRANDTNAMEAFWRRMRMDGFQPDQHAWSTRVYGLLSGRKIQEGLAALAEMGREWINAAKAAKYESLKARAAASTGISERVPPASQIQISAEEYPEDINGVPRPNLVVMNTAVSALATRDDKHIEKALQWGQAFGIEPDVQTYNALLNVTMRHGNVEDSTSILERMQQAGHSLDSSTFTIILTAMFESDEFLKGVPQEQQEQEVLNVIKGLESASHSKVDAKGYAVILDRLLKHHNNPNACRAVLSYMQDQGVEAGTHIYTILMAHYFNCDPPHLEAIDNLWASISSANRGYGIPLDNIFYDRMVEGYATHHAIVGTAPMFRFLQKMTSQGKTPSWYVVRLVAQALAERGEWSRLEQVVHDIRQQGRGGKGGLKMKGMAGQRDFWSFVISTGILEKEGITHPAQVEVFRDDNFSAAAGKADIAVSRATRGFSVGVHI